jgi:hypothetical protein
MYTIGHVIYGVPLTDKISGIIERAGQDPGDLGFTVLYSGAANWTPGYLGEELVEFTECDGDFPLSKLAVQPTAKQRAAAQAKIDGLPPKVKAALGKVDVWVVWSTS